MTGLPKGFKRLATSPTMDGIKSHIATYYGGEQKTLVSRDGTANEWDVCSRCGSLASLKDVARTGATVIETARGFVFGRME